MAGETINTSNYTVGEAGLYFAATVAHDDLISSAFRTSGRKFGHITDVSINPDVTYLEHFVSDKGKMVKDKIVAQQSSLTVSFTFDEMNRDNLAKFFLGSKAASDIQVLQNTLEEGSAQLLLDTDVGQDMVYRIPKCLIRPDGELSLAGDDWHSGPMVLECLRYTDGDTDTASMNATWNVSPFGRVDTANL